MNKIDYDEWHSGPPPSVGWWPASNSNEDDIYRWWNGNCWSEGCVSPASLEAVEFCASCPASKWATQIYWRHRPPSWPKRSRT